MKVICTIPDADCPRGLNICCGTCEHRENCINRCDFTFTHTHEHCSDARVLTDDLVQFESAVPDTLQKITSLLQMKKQMDEQEKQLKQELLKAMEAHGVKSFETDLIKMTYVAPTTKTTLDGAKLKLEHPDIVEQYSKTSNVAASIRIIVKG